MDEQVRIVASRALEELTNDEVITVIEKNYFITLLSIENRNYVGIDFTKKMKVDYTWETYQRDSIKLFNMFDRIPEWYRC